MADESGQPAEMMARLLEVTPRRLNQLANEGRIPRPNNGRYPLVGTVQGYIRFLKSSRRYGDGTDEITEEGVSFRTERALLVRAQRIAAERENLEAERRLVPVEEVETEMAAIFKALGNFLETLPDILEREAGLNPAQAEALQRSIDHERARLHAKVAG